MTNAMDPAEANPPCSPALTTTSYFSPKTTTSMIDFESRIAECEMNAEMVGSRRNSMPLIYFGTCLNMQCLLNRRAGVLFACLLASVQIWLAVPGWTEEVYFGCEYDEETTHETNGSN